MLPRKLTLIAALSGKQVKNVAFRRKSLPNHVLDILGSNTKAIGPTWFWTAMVPKWNRTSIKVRKVQITPENLVRKPWYREEGTRTEIPEPVPWSCMNRGFCTETETEPKNQFRPNTNIKGGKMIPWLGRNSILRYYGMVATASVVPVHDNSAFCHNI